MAAPLSDPIDIPERFVSSAPTPVSTPILSEDFKEQHTEIRNLPMRPERYNRRVKRVLYNSPSDLSISESNPTMYSRYIGTYNQFNVNLHQNNDVIIQMPSVIAYWLRKRQVPENDEGQFMYSNVAILLGYPDKPPEWLTPYLESYWYGSILVDMVSVKGASLMALRSQKKDPAITSLVTTLIDLTVIPVNIITKGGQVAEPS